MIDTFITQLENIGLGDYEARVFGALVQHSPASASFLAKKCNLSRSSVYTTLAGLTAKGLVGTTYKNEVKQFIAQDFGAVEQLIKKEQTIVDKKMKLLDDIKNQFQIFSGGVMNIPQVIFFEGQEGLKKIYLSMMRQAPIGATLHLIRDEFVWQPEWKFIFEEEWHGRVKRLKIEKKITTQLLVNDSGIERGKKKFYGARTGHEVRFLSKKQGVKDFALYIIGDMVSILSMEHQNLVGIKITNQALADNFRNMFGGLWQRSK